MPLNYVYNGNSINTIILPHNHIWCSLICCVVSVLLYFLSSQIVSVLNTAVQPSKACWSKSSGTIVQLNRNSSWLVHHIIEMWGAL